PLTIIGPRGLERVVTALRVIAPELPFDIKYIELSQPEEKIEFKGYIIDAFKVNHNVLCYGYSIEIPRAGKFQLEKAINQGIPKQFWNKLQKGEVNIDKDITYTPSMVMGDSRKGIKIAYCTDTRPTQSIIDKSRDADLLICEGMYGEKEKNVKAIEYKHMTFCEAALVAKKANVKELWLTHFSPSLVRPEEYMGDVKAIFPNAIAGKDGKTVELVFDEE
ncbi:ribonuclease Z, partial [Lachnotalea glycerini]